MPCVSLYGGRDRCGTVMWKTGHRDGESLQESKAIEVYREGRDAF